MLEGKTILVEAEDAGLYWLRRNLITCIFSQFVLNVGNVLNGMRSVPLM